MDGFALADLSVLDLAVIAISAFVAGTCSGMTGFGGGLLLPPILAPILGVQHVVPVLAFSNLMTNAHRLWLYRKHADLKLIGTMLVTVVPGVVIGASIYLALPTDMDLHRARLASSCCRSRSGACWRGAICGWDGRGRDCRRAGAASFRAPRRAPGF